MNKTVSLTWIFLFIATYWQFSLEKSNASTPALSSEPAETTLQPTTIPGYVAHRTDISDFLQSAINSTAGPLKIKIPAGIYVFKKGNIVINRDYVEIEGAGNGHTILTFDPEGPVDAQAPLFVFQKPDNSPLYRTGIKDCVINSNESSFKRLENGKDTYINKSPSIHTKVAIRLVDTSGFVAENISIKDWYGQGSMGIQIQGKELANISRMFISADLPIQIEPNPGLNWISIDHFHFADLTLVAANAYPCINILKNVILTNVTFDGMQSWNRGGYGLKWDGGDSSVPATASMSLKINNVRWEQATAPGGWMIYIHHGHALYNLDFSNLYCQSQHPARAGETNEPVVNGIYLCRVGNVILQNYLFSGPATAIKLDPDMKPSASGHTTVTNVHLENILISTPTAVVDLSGGMNVTGSYVLGSKRIALDDSLKTRH